MFDFEESKRVAIRVGVSLRDWEWMTPRELQLYVDEFNERIKREYEERIIQAYHTALFYRAKKLPSLSRVLHNIRKANRPKQAQTPEEMLEFAKWFTAIYAGKE